MLLLTAIVCAVFHQSQAIALKLNKDNKQVCFYIRGEVVGNEFVLNYGYSGDGYTNVRTTFKNIKEKEYLYEAAVGHPNAVNGFIAQSIQKDNIYSACFESLDNQEKMVSFDYAQVKRQKHMTKDDMNKVDVTLGEIIENQVKLDTRLSYFQSNIFGHTQRSLKPHLSDGNPQIEPYLEQFDEARGYASDWRHPDQLARRPAGFYQVQDH